MNEATRQAANRLHHLSMLYSGALVELVAQKPVGLLHSAHPGLSKCRDFIDLILLVRAELNAISKLLIDAKVLSPDKVEAQFAQEYDWFAQQKAKLYGVELHDHGLVFKAGGGGA